MTRLSRLFREDEAAAIKDTWNESILGTDPSATEQQQINDRVFYTVRKHQWHNTRLEFRVGMLYRIDRRYLLADKGPICKPVHELDKMFREFELDSRYPDHEIGTVYGRLPGYGGAIFPLVGIFDNIRAVVEARKRYARSIAGWEAKNTRMANIEGNMRSVQRSIDKRMREIEARIRRRRGGGP